MAYRTREKLNAYQAERQRRRTAEEDFMANLLDMGAPSSILPLVDSVHLCAIAKCRNKPAVLVVWGRCMEQIISTLPASVVKVQRFAPSKLSLPALKPHNTGLQRMGVRAARILVIVKFTGLGTWASF